MADAAEYKAGFDQLAYDALEQKTVFDKATADAAEFKAGFDKLTVDAVEQKAQVGGLQTAEQARGYPLPPLVAAGSTC